MKAVKISAVAVILSIALGSAPVNQPDQAQAQETQTQVTDPFLRLIEQNKMKAVIHKLRSYIGKTSYVPSGDSPRGWDCSGLVTWAYEQLGIALPHSANEQGHIGKRISKPKLGDIVVFAYQGRSDFYHSALYIGNGKVINANRYYGTTLIEPLSNYKRAQIRYVRPSLNCWDNFRTEAQAIWNCEGKQ